MKGILSEREISELKKVPTNKTRLFNYELKGEIYAETLSQATDIITQIATEKKKCLRMRYVSIQG